MADPHDFTALEQAALIRAREMSSVELAEHYLRRCDALDATVGAFVTRTPDLALEAARAVDARLATGDDLGPLAGVVVPVKDLDFLEGVRFRGGSAVIDLVAGHDDHVVTRMKQGHLVITGKTNTPEFGLPCYTEPDVAPPARTPWDLSRSAGGSRGGAAAAVAAGLASAAQGNDGGGSVRIPASVTGLVGLKPSRGRISNGPWPDGVGELTHHGPLARTVADAAALLDVMAVPFPGDPWIAPALPGGTTFLDATRRDPGRLRVGRYCVPVIAEVEVDPLCLAAYELASDLLASLGHEVDEVAPPYTPASLHSFEDVWAVGALTAPVLEADEERLRPLTRWLRERGRGVSGLGLAQSVAAMRSLARSTIAATTAYDIVLTPTLAQRPARVGGLRNDDDPAADFEAQKRFTPWTSVYNVSGQPAISIPLAWPEVDGVVLPIGIQLVGRPGDDSTVLALAAQLERACPWVHRRPPVW